MSKHTLPPELRASLRARLGGDTRLLAWARAESGQWLVASAKELAQLTDDSWEVWGWEEVLGGGWRKDPGSLHWYTTTGQWECQLDFPGELPSVFRERVQAATVLSASLDVPGGGITLTARRAPGALGPVEWLASATGEVDLTDPDVAALVVEETDRLKAEYGL